MKRLIDRTRWPVLITFSDEGQGHNGFVYRCSGWTPTVRNRRQVNENAEGARCSSYSNGVSGGRRLIRAGHTWIQRWENRVCPAGETANWMTSHGWRRVPIPNRRWANGSQAHTYLRVSA